MRREGRTPLLLGIDVGSTRTKALLLRLDGTEAGVAAVATPFAAREGGIEAEPAALVRAVADALGRARDRLADVEGVGVCGVAESGVPVDAAGRHLAPVIAWHDPRGEEAVEALVRRFGRDELARRIGQQPRTVSSAAKLGWLVAHGVGPVRGWLGVPELVLHELSGALVTEGSLAARTGWFDVVAGAWMPEVAAASGLAATDLLDVRRAGDRLGAVTAEGASWSGLRAGVPVTLAGHDHLAGARGVAAAVDELVNSTGTAETVLARPHARPDVGATLAARVALSLFPGGGCALLSSAARSGLVLGPSGAQAASAEQLEALAERTAEAVERLLPFTAGARRVLVTGGGAASPAWLAAKARRCPLPLLVPRTAEAAARGAAVAAGLAAGWWADWEEAPAPRRDPVPPGRGGPPAPEPAPA